MVASAGGDRGDFVINGDMIDGVTANDDLNEGAGRCGARARISAIVVSYFTGPVLGRCLDALRRQDGVCEVILVDNGNPDGVVKAAIGDTGAPTPVKLVSGHGNVGFATACNLGARAASGDVLLFVNPDAVMPPGGAARLAADGAAKGGAWLIGAKIVDPDGAEQRGSRRATLTPWRAFVEATKLYRFAPKHPYFRRFNLHGDPCPDDVIALPVISGACFMTPKNDYFALGGMDERYFLHVEDVDFCLRFRAAGGRVFFDPHVSVLHYKSSSRVDPLFVEMRKTASMLRYFRTHFSEVYPAPFMWMVAAVAWMQFGVLAAFKILRRIFVPWRVFVRRARASVTRR